MSNLTIDEVKEKQIKLESKLTKLFKAFEKESGVKVGYIDVIHKMIKVKPEPNDVDSAMPYDSTRQGALKTVKINLNFED